MGQNFRFKENPDRRESLEGDKTSSRGEINTKDEMVGKNSAELMLELIKKHPEVRRVLVVSYTIGHGDRERRDRGYWMTPEAFEMYVTGMVPSKDPEKGMLEAFTGFSDAKPRSLMRDSNTGELLYHGAGDTSGPNARKRPERAFELTGRVEVYSKEELQLIAEGKEEEVKSKIRRVESAEPRKYQVNEPAEINLDDSAETVSTIALPERRNIPKEENIRTLLTLDIDVPKDYGGTRREFMQWMEHLLTKMGEPCYIVESNPPEDMDLEAPPAGGFGIVGEKLYNPRDLIRLYGKATREALDRVTPPEDQLVNYEVLRACGYAFEGLADLEGVDIKEAAKPLGLLMRKRIPRASKRDPEKHAYLNECMVDLLGIANLLAEDAADIYGGRRITAAGGYKGYETPPIVSGKFEPI